MKVTKRKITLCLMAILTAVSVSVTAYAAEELPDLEKRGSISVTVKDSKTKKPVTDGGLTLYQVADLQVENKQYSYVFTDDFQDSGLSLNHIGSAKLPAALAEYASGKQDESIDREHAELSESGTVTFTDLPVGLYLVVQDTTAKNYSKLQPFLVSIPMNNDGELIYDVDASPKAGTVTYTEPEKPDKPDKPSNPPGSKLPKTGQLWWPVLLLDVAGLLLIVVGWLDRNRAKEHT